MRKSILYLSLCLVFAVSMLGVGIFLFNDLNFSSVETQLDKSEEDETPETQGWSGNLLAYVKLYKNGSLSSLTSGFKISLYASKGPTDLITSSTNGSLQYDLSSLSSSYFNAYLSVSRNGAGGEADGYVFSGWYTSSSCTGQPVSLFSQYISSGTTTYYARYNYANTRFTLNDNGGSGGDGSMSATYGRSYPSVTVPSRTGYNFYGYWTSSNGGTQYYDANGNSTQTYCSYNHNQTTPTLYARWVPIEGYVTYDGNGGTVWAPEPMYYIIDGSNTLTGAERDGYKFLGWKPTTSSGGWSSGTIYPSGYSVNGKYGDITLVAQWEKQEFELDVNAVLDGSLSGTLGSYATFDVYINGSRVATQVNDYCSNITAGASYQITNIKYATDKALVGTYHDNECTVSGSLSGTMPAERRTVCLKIRTKTWNDYAASSFASGSGTAASPYIIKTAAQLAKVAKDSRSSTLSGKCYKLGADINLSAHVWEGIGSESSAFEGGIDGNLYAIKNIKTSVDSYIVGYGGLVAYGSPVLNRIIMRGGEVVGQNDSAAIVGSLRSTAGSVQNCIVDNVSVRCTRETSMSVGAIAGYSAADIVNCMVINSTLSGCYCGGIVGYAESQQIDCAVINSSITGTNVNIIHGRYSTTMQGCYGAGSVNGSAVKQMYGSSSDFGNWTYSPAINDGYPVQKTLFHIGGMSGSENVYNYLLNKLNLILDMDKYMA